MTTGGAVTTRVAPMTRTKDRVHIVGFAPSWTETPWNDKGAERWGLNALHRVAPGPWDRWFQLHDLAEHHGSDHEHYAWLQQADFPIYQWADHIAKYKVRAAVPYPKDWILNQFGDYFTNSISWMIALAIAMEFKEIGVYGVDMAKDAVIGGEYSHQRPSCEWLIGWARGKGIKVYIPATADLMKTTHLYGAQRGDEYRLKLESRLKDLQQRKAQHDQQVQMHQQASLQLSGAIDNTTWLIKTWLPPYPSTSEGLSLVQPTIQGAA